LIDHVHSLEFLVRELQLRLLEKDELMMSPEQLIEIALDRQPQFRAGESFRYGDTNYVIAGLVIQRAPAGRRSTRSRSASCDRSGSPGSRPRALFPSRGSRSAISSR